MHQLFKQHNSLYMVYKYYLKHYALFSTVVVLFYWFEETCISNILRPLVAKKLFFPWLKLCEYWSYFSTTFEFSLTALVRFDFINSCLGSVGFVMFLKSLLLIKAAFIWSKIQEKTVKYYCILKYRFCFLIYFKKYFIYLIKAVFSAFFRVTWSSEIIIIYLFSMLETVVTFFWNLW